MKDLVRRNAIIKIAVTLTGIIAVIIALLVLLVWLS